MEECIYNLILVMCWFVGVNLLTSSDVPLPPTDLMVVGEGPRHVILKWSPPPSGSADAGTFSSVSAYRVTYIAETGQIYCPNRQFLNLTLNCLFSI